MPNPNNLEPKVTTTVLIVTGGASAEGFTSPLFVSEFLASPSFPTRIKAYTGSASEKAALLGADGFAADSVVRLQVAAAMAQDGPPATIYIGRKDAGDADWGVSLDAISAENSDDWYALAIEDRDSASIQQVSAWVEPPGLPPKFALFIAQTDSAQVRDEAPGNFADVIAALGRDRTALMWHDPATSSGLAPAQISTRTGSFAFGASETLGFRFDGGVTQSYPFVSTAAALTGSNSELFDLSAGGVLTLAANGLDSQDVDTTTTGATVVCGAAETYPLTAGSTLTVRVDGGAAGAATMDAAAAVDLGSTTEPFAPVNLEHLDVKVNGGASQVFTFDGTETTAQLTADLINLTALGFVAADVGGAVELRSDRQGTSASIEIEAATSANIVTEYGLAVGTVAGTGDAADISATTAAELAAVIASDIAGATAVDESGQVRITVASLGTASRVQVTGGAINTIVLFPTSEVSGTGPFADGSAASAVEVASLINASVAGMVASAPGTAVILTSDVLGTASAVTVTAGVVATTLGLAAGTVSGTGPFANAATATASEIAIEINTAGIVGGTAVEISSAVVLASATSGPASSVEIITDTVGLSWSGDGFAVGVGTSEDYADCAWIGRCITFDLDGENGVALWDNQSLVGIAPDALTKAQRTNLDQRRINVYVSLRRGRSETHWGYILRKDAADFYRYIDEQTSADWLDSRYSEGMDDLLNSYADQKAKINFEDGAGGFALIENRGRDILLRADRNGHTTYDGSSLDLLDDKDTGVFFPRFSDLTQANINQREYAGVRIRQNYRPGTQRIGTIIELQRPPVQL